MRWFGKCLGQVTSLDRTSSRNLNPILDPTSNASNGNEHDGDGTKARNTWHGIVRQLDLLSGKVKVPSFLTGDDSEEDELQQRQDALLKHLAEIREEIEAIQGSDLDKSVSPVPRWKTDSKPLKDNEDDKTYRSYYGALVSVVHSMVFCAALLAAAMRTASGNNLVSREQVPWHGSAALPLVAFSAPPVNHSYIIEQCTILEGDYMGRDCVDISTLVDYACPELLNAEEYTHYQSAGSFCINSEAYLRNAKPAIVEDTFGSARYDYVRVDLMRDSGEAQSGFVNVMIW